MPFCNTAPERRFKRILADAALAFRAVTIPPGGVRLKGCFGQMKGEMAITNKPYGPTSKKHLYTHSNDTIQSGFAQ